MAFTVGNEFRKSLFKHARKNGQVKLPDSFHHSDRNTPHQHAHFFSEDTNKSGFIDQIIVYKPTGIEQCVFELLPSFTSFNLHNQKINITPIWMGSIEHTLAFGPSKTWQSETPYITPWHRMTKQNKLRKNYEPQGQIIKETILRNLPSIETIEFKSANWMGGLEAEMIFASQFENRYQKERPTNDAVGSYVNITFKEPIQGPLSLGYGSHFGLGYLAPIEAS
jgi:CRISPR-associated protein Csb2